MEVYDLVKDTTQTTGTGTFTLDNSAPTGYRTYGSATGAANKEVFYHARSADETEWEIGIGTYTHSGTTLSRDTVLQSSNAGALVNFTAAGATVFCPMPAAFIRGPISLSATRQNVTSTAETDTTTVVIPANTWEDGGELELREYLMALNNTGGNVAWTRKLYVDATAVTVSNSNRATSATVHSYPIATRLIRIGADIYRQTTFPGSLSQFHDVAISAAITASNSVTLVASGVDFTADITVKLSMQLATYNASTSYYNCVGAKATLG